MTPRNAILQGEARERLGELAAEIGPALAQAEAAEAAGQGNLFEEYS